MSSSSRRIDRLQATFDQDGLVANASLIVPATLMARLGLEALINTWVRTGSVNAGRKILTPNARVERQASGLGGCLAVLVQDSNSKAVNG